MLRIMLRSKISVAKQKQKPDLKDDFGLKDMLEQYVSS
jgi:hypothetical protein